MARDRLIKATRQEDDQHPAPRSRSVVIILGGALAAVVLVLYWRTARYEFVNLDDFVYVVENPVVRRGLSVDGLRWAVSTYHTGNWHPLTWVSLMGRGQLVRTSPTPCSTPRAPPSYSLPYTV